MLHLLLALAIAATLAIAGYAALLVGGQTTPATAAPVTLPALPLLPEPKPLPARSAVQPASYDGFPAAGHGGRLLAIEVTGVPEVAPATAGVAVFAAATMSLLQWLPCPAAARTGGTVHLQAVVPSGQDVVLHLAPTLAAARHGFWRTVDVSGDSGAAAVIASAVQPVLLRIATVPEAIGSALQLRRRGVADWLPLNCGFGIPEQGRLELWLDAGEYELTCLPAPGQSQLVTVPGPREQTVQFVRPLVRVDRP